MCLTNSWKTHPMVNLRFCFLENFDYRFSSGTHETLVDVFSKNRSMSRDLGKLNCRKIFWMSFPGFVKKLLKKRVYWGLEWLSRTKIFILWARFWTDLLIPNGDYPKPNNPIMSIFNETEIFSGKHFKYLLSFVSFLVLNDPIMRVIMLVPESKLPKTDNCRTKTGQKDGIKDNLSYFGNTKKPLAKLKPK